MRSAALRRAAECRQDAAAMLEWWRSGGVARRSECGAANTSLLKGSSASLKRIGAMPAEAVIPSSRSGESKLFISLSGEKVLEWRPPRGLCRVYVCVPACIKIKTVP